MKKLLLVLGISLGFISSLFAEELDFIALATKGKFNQRSEGVRVLNDEEMSKVVGGYTYISYIPYKFNPAMHMQHYNPSVKTLSNDERGVQEGRIAPIIGWGIRQGIMWGVRYTAWGTYSQRHPLNGNNGWRW